MGAFRSILLLIGRSNDHEVQEAIQSATLIGRMDKACVFRHDRRVESGQPWQFRAGSGSVVKVK
jgi:hypothetical protein